MTQSMTQSQLAINELEAQRMLSNGGADNDHQVAFITSSIGSGAIYTATTMAIDNKNYQYSRDQADTSADSSPTASGGTSGGATGSRVAALRDTCVNDYRYRKISQQNHDQLTVSLYDDYDIDLLS